MRPFLITLIFFYKLLGDTHEPRTHYEQLFLFLWKWSMVLEGGGMCEAAGCGVSTHDYTGAGRMIGTVYSKTRDFI